MCRETGHQKYINAIYMLQDYVLDRMKKDGHDFWLTEKQDTGRGLPVDYQESTAATAILYVLGLVRRLPYESSTSCFFLHTSFK